MRTIGVDVGGTFTDLVYFDRDSGALAIHKVSTTPEDPSLGVMTGIAELCDANGIDPGGIDYVFHGTTTATNAVLEHKGAVAGMITNQGFRDIIHIARHQRVEHGRGLDRFFELLEHDGQAELGLGDQVPRQSAGQRGAVLGGRSHDPAENTSEANIRRGAMVYCETVRRILAGHAVRNV